MAALTCRILRRSRDMTTEQKRRWSVSETELLLRFQSGPQLRLEAPTDDRLVAEERAPDARLPVATKLIPLPPLS